MFLIIATVVVGGGLAGLAYYVWNYTQQPTTLPAGPTYLPWLGYSLSTTEKASTAQLEQWRKIYGQVFTVSFHKEYAVVVNGYSGVEEILAREDIRPALPHEMPTLSKMETGDEHNVSIKEWFRVFGLCKSYLTDNWKTRRTSKIQDEAAYMSDYLHSVDKSPTDIKQLFSPCVANILCALLYGQCYDQDDKQLLHLLYSADVVSSHMLHDTFSELLGFTPSINSEATVSAAIADLSSFNRAIIEKRRARLEEDGYDDPRDFVEFCLCQNEESESEEDVETFDNTLIHVLNYLMYNATPVLSDILKSQTELLAKYPDVQTKMHQELERVFGFMPVQFDVHDKDKLPYMRAVLSEALRLSPAITVLQPRVTLGDVQYRGCILPTNMTVYLNLYSSHRDEDTWKDANIFNPGRFLTEEGVFTENVEQYQPFKQTVDPVDELAEDVMFILMASLLQSFRISLPAEVNGSVHPKTDDKKSEQIEPDRPDAHQLVFSSRF